MTKRDFNITNASRGAAITVKIVPKANKTEIVGLDPDGTLKVRLMSPPVEGQANQELVEFLAEFMGISMRDVEIVAGLDSRKKLVSMLNISAIEVEQKVHTAVAGDD